MNEKTAFKGRKGMEKCCSRCGKTKPLKEFYRAVGNLDGLKSNCKDCISLYYKRRRASDPAVRDRIRERERNRRAKNPEKYRLQRRRYRLKWQYNLSEEQIDHVISYENGPCDLCGKPQGRGRHLFVDHDHATGQIRGLLCDSCNRGIGFFDEDSSRLRRIADYIDKHKSGNQKWPVKSTGRCENE